MSSKLHGDQCQILCWPFHLIECKDVAKAVQWNQKNPAPKYFSHIIKAKIIYYIRILNIWNAILSRCVFVIPEIQVLISHEPRPLSSVLWLYRKPEKKTEQTKKKKKTIFNNSHCAQIYRTKRWWPHGFFFHIGLLVIQISPFTHLLFLFLFSNHFFHFIIVRAKWLRPKTASMLH